MAASPSSTLPLPTLESGDRMEREEFERRYCARPDIKKAELIDGVVYVASPVRVQHSDPHGILMAVLGAYRLSHVGVTIGDNGTYRCPDGSEVQPDIVLRYTRATGGGAWVDDDHYLQGVPELLAEVAASSRSYDTHVKRALYERASVPEYLIWRTEDEAFDWWRLVDGAYERIEPGAGGSLASTVFPGLVIHPAELIRMARESFEGG